MFGHTNTAENYFSILKRGIFASTTMSARRTFYATSPIDFRYNQRIALGVNDDQHMIQPRRESSEKRLTSAA